MWITYYILTAIVFHATMNIHANANRRQRRYLLFTKGTQWGVFATISVPLEPPEATVSMAWFFEANYYAVDNSTYLEPLLGDIQVSDIGKKRSTTTNNFLTRRYFYTIIESMLEKPSTSLEEDNLEDCYYEAEYWGLEDACGQYEKTCPVNLLHYISVYIHDKVL